jgi:hypothetical protein
MPPHDTVRISASAVDASPDLVDSQSPATYIGHDRVENFIGQVVPGQSHVYREPKLDALNAWSLTGRWTAGAEYTTPDAVGGKIACRFHARDPHMALGPGPAARQRASMS